MVEMRDNKLFLCRFNKNLRVICDSKGKGLRALRPFFGSHLRSKYECGNKSISLHDFIRPIFLVFHFGFSLDIAVH